MNNSKNPLSYNGLKRSGGLALAALLIFSVAAAVMVYSPKSAIAQAVPTITTSSDKFFGNSFAQVIINDSTKNSDSATQESTTVTVRVKDNTGAIKQSGSINAQEIGKNSGQFEFFVTTEKKSATPGVPQNPRSFPAASTSTAVVRFGPGYAAGDGNANDLVLDTTTTPANNWKVEIEYSGASGVKTINYQTSAAQFNVDRTSIGAGNTVIFGLTDQDANVDPTKADSFQATLNTAGTALVLGNSAAGTNILLTGSFAAGTYTFTETGQNTNVFEAQFTPTQLGVSSFASPTTKSYILKDYDVYDSIGTLFTGPQSTTSTITQSIVFQNQDGTITPLSQITAASGVPITVTDSDLNTNTRSEDNYVSSGTTGIKVKVDATGGDEQWVDLKETGDNTGVFVANLNNGKLPISLVPQSTDLVTGATHTDGVLRLRPSDISGNKDIVIEYRDPNRAAGATANTLTSTVRLPLTHVAGQLAWGAGTVTSTSKATITLTDNDLNTNNAAVDSYTVALTGTGSSGVYSFAEIPDFAALKVQIKGSVADLGTGQTIVFIETGVNTGIFTAQVDMQKLGATFSDGDQVAFTYQDKMESPTAENTATVTIGKPSTAINVDRTTAPIPLKSTEPTAVVGGTPTTDIIKIRLTVTDPSQNKNSGTQETISVGPGASMVNVKLLKSDGTSLASDLTTSTIFTVGGTTLTETGPDTGIFTGQVTLTRGSTGSISDLDNAKVIFTYDSNTATTILRPSDLVISVSSTTVKNGDSLTVTITDGDRNLDAETVDQIPFKMVAQNDVIGTDGEFTSTAKETGPNTGVFTKEVKIGTDIKVTKYDGSTITQATELKLTATDRVATDDSHPDRDLTIRVGGSTGLITVTPDMVGPGTKLTILVNDTDLNRNPAGVDTVPSTAEYVTVTTDRSGFIAVKAAGEETGPNTGQFKTTVKLQPKIGGLTAATGDKDITGFQVLPGDLISVKYVDAKDASGNKVTTSKIVKVVSVDPTMNATSATISAGGTVSLTISDLDANTDGEVVDSVKVRVTSDSDPVGFDVTGLETGANTGVFSISFPTTTSVSSGSLTVKTGDNISVKYTDTYPSDYADRVKQVVDPSKDFTLVIPVGVTAGGDTTATTAANPVLKDFSGKNLTEVTSGQQVVLSSTVTNNQGTARPFAAIVEVRNADGETVYLQWQQGTLNANGSTNIGLSWTPDVSGTYTARTFVVTNISSPAALSTVSESTITVS